MTLPELAERTGINRHTLGRYENGRQEPSFARGLLVAHALGVSPDLLIVHAEDVRTPGGACALPETTPTPDLPPSGYSRDDGAKAGAR